MDDQMGYEDPRGPEDTGAGTTAQDWVVVKFPDRARGRRGGAAGERSVPGREAERLFDDLSILSNYCYGQGHIGLYDKFEQLALDLARAMSEVAETLTIAGEGPAATAPRRGSVGGADEEGAV